MRRMKNKDNMFFVVVFAVDFVIFLPVEGGGEQSKAYAINYVAFI